MAFDAYAAEAYARATYYYHADMDVSPCYTVFMRHHRLNNNIANRIAFALYCIAARIDGASYPFVAHVNDGVVHDVAANHAICYANGVDAGDIINLAANNDLMHNYQGFSGIDARELFHFIEHGGKWLVELCGARVIRDLSQDNVENYFLMCSMAVDPTDMLMRVITHIARTSANDLSNDNIRGQLRRSAWGLYRLSVTSIGNCFNLFRSSYGNVVTARVFANVAYLEAAFATPWDQAVAARVIKGDIGIIAMGLEVAGIFPRGWVSGDRELRSMGMAQRGRLQALFRRLIALISNTAVIEQALDINGALAAAGY